MGMFEIHTFVVGSPLAFQMRRVVAARANECGLQILTLPQLAARLADGFATPLTPENLDLAIRDALAEGGFAELDSVRHLPSMTRAVSRSLRKLWDADVDLRAEAHAENVRLGDLALIEERLRRHLPVAVLMPRDLRNAALGQIRYAARATIEAMADALDAETISAWPTRQAASLAERIETVDMAPQRTGDSLRPTLGRHNPRSRICPEL